MTLYDEHIHWTNLLPLTFTRSVAECRVGILTIAEKWEHYLNEKIHIQYAESYLQNESVSDALRVASHILPTRHLAEAVTGLQDNQSLQYQGEIIASRNPTNTPEIISYTQDLKSIRYPWHIFLLNDEELKKDYELITAGRISAPIPEDNRTMGDQIFLEEGAVVHGAILNSLTGPIYMGHNAEVMEGAMIRGGLALGTKAQIKMGAKIYGATTIGPGCRVGGEVTNTIFFANSNKGHDGYLGNSVLGEWCNLGADTNSSNLKNNYAKVDVYNYSEKKAIDTGEQFCGLIMGDHSKSGINTMFNTGTVVGVSANIVGAGFPSKHIPSFSWSIQEKIRPYDIEKSLETARIVYERRGRVLSDREENVLRHIHSLSLPKSTI